MHYKDIAKNVRRARQCAQSGMPENRMVPALCFFLDKLMEHLEWPDNLWSPSNTSDDNALKDAIKFDARESILYCTLQVRVDENGPPAPVRFGIQMVPSTNRWMVIVNEGSELGGFTFGETKGSPNPDKKLLDDSTEYLIRQLLRAVKK